MTEFKILNSSSVGEHFKSLMRLHDFFQSCIDLEIKSFKTWEELEVWKSIFTLKVWCFSDVISSIMESIASLIYS